MKKKWQFDRHSGDDARTIRIPNFEIILPNPTLRNSKIHHHCKNSFVDERDIQVCHDQMTVTFMTSATVHNYNSGDIKAISIPNS